MKNKDFKRQERVCNEIKTSSAKQGFEAQTRTSNETQEVARKERLRTKRKHLLSIPWFNYRDTGSKEKFKNWRANKGGLTKRTDLRNEIKTSSANKGFQAKTKTSNEKNTCNESKTSSANEGGQKKGQSWNENRISNANKVQTKGFNCVQGLRAKRNELKRKRNCKCKQKKPNKKLQGKQGFKRKESTCLAFRITGTLVQKKRARWNKNKITRANKGGLTKRTDLRNEIKTSRANKGFEAKSKDFKRKKHL